jgi:hypothetical protein
MSATPMFNISGLAKSLGLSRSTLLHCDKLGLLRLRRQQNGYRVLTRFDMGQSALDHYYHPLEARLRGLEGKMEGTRVLEDLCRELRAYHEGKEQSGKEMFLLRRR